jgi:hypothetical protein
MGDVWGGMKVYYFGQVSFIIEGRYVFLGQHCTATVVPSYMYYGTFKKIKYKIIIFGDKKKVSEPGFKLETLGLADRSYDR